MKLTMKDMNLAWNYICFKRNYSIGISIPCQDPCAAGVAAGRGQLDAVSGIWIQRVSPDGRRCGVIEPQADPAEKSSFPGRTNRRGMRGGRPTRVGFARRERENEAMCAEFPAHPRGDRQSWGGG